MMGKILNVAGVTLFVLAASSGTALADRAELQKKLKQEIAVDLNDVTIEAALREIGGEAGLRIDLSEEAIWKLPDGANTRLSVKLEGQLSKSLEQMLNSFFMRYAVGGEALTVYPRPELKRIIGRPTGDELKLLGNIYTNKTWITVTGGNRELPEGIVQKVINGLTQEPVAIMPPREADAIGKVMESMATRSTSSSGSPHDPNSPKGTPVTLASLLEGVERIYTPAKTWYIEGPEFPRHVAELWIVTKDKFWQAHLDQIVDVSFHDETGETVAGTLAAMAGLTVQFQGGHVPEGLARRVTLEVQNAKLIDVLDRALSVLDVLRTINLTEGVVELHAPPTTTAAAKKLLQQATSESQASGGYVGKISIPMEGGRYFIEFMLRESDLTDELRQLRQAKIREILEQLSKTGREP